MRITIISATLLSAAFAFPQAAPSSVEASSAALQTTIASPEEVPQATSIAEVAASNVTIPVDVSSELLDSIPLNADDPALKSEDPIATSEFLSPADFLTTGLSLDDIPDVPVEQSAIGARDLSGSQYQTVSHTQHQSHSLTHNHTQQHSLTQHQSQYQPQQIVYK